MDAATTSGTPNSLFRFYEYTKQQLDDAKAALDATETARIGLQQRYKAVAAELTAALVVSSP